MEGTDTRAKGGGMSLTFGPLKGLDADRVRWLVIHTAGTPDGQDTSAAAIHAYHRQKGWSGVGYHFVIRQNGDIETGRPLTKQGAHTYGINDRSIGLAFSGNGDLFPITPEQRESGLDLAFRLCRLYDIDVADVIGHREVNRLVERGIVGSHCITPKSCPGVRVHLVKIRLALADLLHPPPEPVALTPTDRAA
jgi:N-acetylmuramoyl-L-alanine amidase